MGGVLRCFFVVVVFLVFFFPKFFFIIFLLFFSLYDPADSNGKIPKFSNILPISTSTPNHCFFKLSSNILR